MESKITKTYQFQLKDLNKRLNPFKFETKTVYYISDNASGFNLSNILPVLDSIQITKKLKNKGYDFVYWSGSYNDNIEDLANIYQYYVPINRLSFPDNSSEKKSSTINKIHYADLIQQFLAIEEQSKDIFIYTDTETLYVLQVQEIININTKSIIDEVVQSIPDISAYVELYSPFGYDPEKDEDYFELDNVTKEFVKEIFEKFDKFNKSGQFLAILPFLEKQINIAKNQIERELSFLYVDENYKIFLKDYDKEVKMSHLTKSLYFLFLMKSEIDLTEIQRFEEELLVIYKHISNQENIDKMEESVSLLLRNENNELYIHFSRIKSAFCKVINQEIAKNYYVKGAKSSPKSIELDKGLTNIFDLRKHWFPNTILFDAEDFRFFNEFFKSSIDGSNFDNSDKNGDLPF